MSKVQAVAARVCLATLLVALMAVPSFATDVTLPTTGVDIPGLVTAAVTALGTIIASVVGAMFAFLVIRKGLRWARGI